MLLKEDSMPGMPELMSKGEILKKLDAYYKDPGPCVLKEQLCALQALPPYPEGNVVTYYDQHIRMNGKPLLTQKEANHICLHWFNDLQRDGTNDPNGEGWWKDIQPIEPIIRQGLITAIDAAMNDYSAASSGTRPRPLPIVFYWMCHAGHPDHPGPSPQDTVEVAVTWSDYQVTFIVHTPDTGHDEPLTGTEPIFVVKRVNADYTPGDYETELGNPTIKAAKNRIILRRP